MLSTTDMDEVQMTIEKDKQNPNVCSCIPAVGQRGKTGK